MTRPTHSVQHLLRELVALPSVHPEGDAGGTVQGEAGVGRWVADYLRSLGADVELPLLAPGRPSVVAVFEPARPARETVVFAPHLDTVGVQGMTVPPFELTRAAGRLHGRGACDTKGPMAALLCAFARWTRSVECKKNQVRWIVAATAGEEQGSLGAEALLKSGFRADFAVAIEPTALNVVSAAKGILRVWIEIPGRAAHGSKPEMGVNAIYRSLALLQALRDEVAPALAACRHPVLGKATLNLGVVQGGSELNLVPALCRVGLDIRVHPDCHGTEALRLLKAALAQQAPSGHLLIHRQGPPFVTDRRHVWARRLRRAGRGWATADWFCDANVFTAYGIPSVAFGPGHIKQAHTRDEYITERDLDAGVNAFSKFLADR